jgi:hypothetical protein
VGLAFVAANYMSASVITSQNSAKSLSASGCGPLLTVVAVEIKSPVVKSNVAVNVMNPASRERTGPCGVCIFSGRPLKVVMNVTVFACSFTIAWFTTCPAIEAVTAFPFTGFVNVTVKEKVSFELPSAKRKKLSTLLNVASTGIPQTLAEKLPVE